MLLIHSKTTPLILHTADTSDIRAHILEDLTQLCICTTTPNEPKLPWVYQQEFLLFVFLGEGYQLGASGNFVLRSFRRSDVQHHMDMLLLPMFRLQAQHTAHGEMNHKTGSVFLPMSIRGQKDEDILSALPDMADVLSFDQVAFPPLLKVGAYQPPNDAMPAKVLNVSDSEGYLGTFRHQSIIFRQAATFIQFSSCCVFSSMF